MLFALIKYELRNQLNKLVFWLAAFVFLFFGFMLGSQGASLANLKINSAYQIMFNTSLLSLSSVFAIMFFTVRGIMRDHIHNMSAIIYSTPISKYKFVVSRFSGVFLASLLAVGMILIGLGLSIFSPNVDPVKLTQFSLSFYVWTWCLTVLPTIFICTSIIFSIGLISRNSMTIYIAAIAIYALYFICSAYFNSPLLAQSKPPTSEGLALAGYLDPLGISAFFEVTQNWTTFEKNSLMVGIGDNYLWSRLLWIFISAIILFISFFKFTFRIKDKKPKRTLALDTQKPLLLDSNLKVPIAYSSLLSFYSSLRLEVSSLFKSLPFLAFLVIWIIIVVTEVYSRIIIGGEYGEKLYPTTSLMVWLLDDPFHILCIFLLVFYSGEIIWKERDVNLAKIIDATPISNAVFFFSKFFSLSFIPVVLLTIGFLITIGFQLSKGYFKIDFLMYLGRYYYNIAPFPFFIILGMFIQTWVKNKYLGMMLMMLFILFFSTSLASFIGLYHPLLNIGKLPMLAYSEMIGYGDYHKPFNYFFLLWTSAAGVLGILTYRFWNRGILDTWSSKYYRLVHHWGKIEIAILLGVVTTLIFFTSLIYYNLNVLTNYSSPVEILDKQEAYERLYKKYDTDLQLFPLKAIVYVDFYPSEKRFFLKSDLILENKSDSSIHTIVVTEKDPISQISFERGKLESLDESLKVRLFSFSPPLLPGEQIQYKVEIIKELKGFERDTRILSSSSYLLLNRVLPSLSYLNGREISDNIERKKRGLEPLRIEEPEEDHLRFEGSRMNKVFYEATISTEKGQQPLGPGNRVKSWEEGKRSFAMYNSDVAISPMLAFASGEYEIKKEAYKGVMLEQMYYKGHDANIDAMMLYTKNALDYCTKNYAAYPFKQLTTIELPKFWQFGGQAMAGMISMVEDRMYLIDNSDPEFDLVAKRTIHEVAHQWWGYILAPKYVDGANLFTEGLAKYTEAMVMKEYYGRNAIRQLCKSANNRYLRGRSYSTEPEPALYVNTGEGYLAYGKSLLSIMSLYQIIGEEKMNAAIKEVVDSKAPGIEPLAISLDLIQSFYNVTDKEEWLLIDDWFKKLMIYDIEAKKVSVMPLENGKYEISLTFNVLRERVNEDGSSIKTKVNEPIEIAFLKTQKEDLSKENILLWTERKIQSGINRIKITCDEKPAFISIDPMGYRPEKNKVNNTIRVE